jgi:hypothetical protein
MCSFEVSFDDALFERNGGSSSNYDRIAVADRWIAPRVNRQVNRNAAGLFQS